MSGLRFCLHVASADAHCFSPSDSSICEWSPVQHPVYSLCETGSQRDGEITPMSSPALRKQTETQSVFLGPVFVFPHVTKRPVVKGETAGGSCLSDRKHRNHSYNSFCLHRLKCAFFAHLLLQLPLKKGSVLVLLFVYICCNHVFASWEQSVEEILRCYSKEGNPDLKRQIEFIIKQLNSGKIVTL